MTVIGIAGGSGSGKSTLAVALQKELPSCRLFAMDAYYRQERDLPLVMLPNGKAYRDYNCPDAFELARLKADLRTCIAQDECEFLLIEGLLTLWDKELRELLDHRIVLDCPADIRIVRRLRRNLSWGLSFDEIADVYLDLVRDRHEEYVAPSAEHADLLLDSTRGVSEHIPKLLSILM